MRIRFTLSAKAQFLRALTYIKRDKPEAAKRFRITAEHALRRLERFPDSGRQLPEFPDLPFREVVVAPYRFFYRTADDVIWILAVWHGAQIPTPPHAEGQ